MKMIRIGLVLLCLLTVGCGGEITAFECNTSDNCDKDSNCVEGKCIKQDNDKDGWAKGKDCTARSVKKSATSVYYRCALR